MNPETNTEDKPVPVKITVVRGKNLRGSKSDNFQSSVRVEFNEAVLGNSPRKQAASAGKSVAQRSVDYDFTCSFDCLCTAVSLDHMAHKPVIVTVMEILSREKKQAEERTAVLGQAVLDLLPLLQGQCSFSSTVPLYPTPGSPIEAAPLEGENKPSLDVSVSVPDSLLSDAQLSASNLLRVTVETAYSVPEVWNPVAGPAGPPPSSYIAALQIPVTAEREQVLLFPNGFLKSGGKREAVGRPKRWPLAALLAQRAHFLPGVSIQPDPVEKEDGELTRIEHRMFRNEAEMMRKRVSWDAERRCFLDAGGVARLSQRIGEHRLWPVEMMMSLAQEPKGRKAGRLPAEDELQISFHGVAYVDMGPLLYPGASRIRGAYRVFPFTDADLRAKTKRTVSVLRDLVRTLATQDKQPTNSPGGSGSRTFDSVGGDHLPKGSIKESPRKSSVQGGPGGADIEMDMEPQVNAEGQMYIESQTYIIIEVSLEKPLVAKRSPEELAKRVKELIPPRPPPSPSDCPTRAERAVQEYHSQVNNVIAQLLDKYQELFGPAFLPGAEPLDPSTQEQRKIQLLGELNYTGKYFAFKEQLKSSVLRLAREKMLRTEDLSDPEKLRALISQLYVYLVDQMHVALNKSLSADSLEVPVQPQLDFAQLRHFAKEAELIGDYQLAARYYQEQVVREPTEPSHWFDYGALYMLTGEHLKAEACFHRALSVQQTHLPSLMICGILEEMSGHFTEAQTYLERATCIDPSAVVACTLLGLFHVGQNNSIQAERCFLEAGKQLRATLVPSPTCLEAEHSADKPQLEEAQQREEEVSMPGCKPLSVKPECAEQEAKGKRRLSNWCQEGAPPRLNTTIYMETAQFLLRNTALQVAERALSQELLCSDGGPSISYHLALARLQLLRKDYRSAATSLEEVLHHNSQEADVWALYGHCHYLAEEFREAQMCYERALVQQQEPSETHSIYLRLGSIYLQEREFESARVIYLRACGSSPSCLTWLGLGIACYQLERLGDAEEALVEASSLNNMNPEVWGYLALVYLKSGRKAEAEQSYKYVVKLNLQKEPLLREIRELQDRLGFGDPSF
ncbi:cilia- and flagella-associated protein 70 [Lampris incognitus]|uniref:cilia- and flagella-associated protein 70 n=1 Tax=Lampris incognitus TaxID=2546036 RepID=UPI0024B54BB1|nr:cilia- and flagella-associated protein 70 [Lampris incognitus]